MKKVDFSLHQNQRATCYHCPVSHKADKVQKPALTAAIDQKQILVSSEWIAVSQITSSGRLMYIGLYIR